MSEARTPAQIEADIVRRRQELAVTLDEIGVRVHPKTIIGDAKAKAAAAVDRTAGRAYVAVNRAVTDVRAQFVVGGRGAAAGADRSGRAGRRGRGRPADAASSGAQAPQRR